MPSSASATSGIGRKVAASLQLFKETAAGQTAEDPKAREPSRAEVSIGRHKAVSPIKGDNVAEPQFEFVKRSEWPGREAAAIRREKSSTGLSRVRTRESASGNDYNQEAESSRGKERKVSVRDTVINDLTQWRKDVMNRQDSGRGRRLERASEMLDPEFGSPDSALSVSTVSTPRDPREQVPSVSPYPRPQSQYPPSPSPSRSPSNRTPALSFPDLPSEPIPISRVYRTPVPELPSVRSHSRSSTPIQTSPTPTHISPPHALPEAYIPDFRSHSPWSTDEESGWETASATTSTSTTSATSFLPISPSHIHSVPESYLNFPSEDGDEDRQRYLPLESILDVDTAAVDDVEDDFGIDLDLSQDNLPHIPLRPFRNQVGGHSAIYKFTKRAVCKVLISSQVPFIALCLLSS